MNPHRFISALRPHAARMLYAWAYNGPASSLGRKALMHAGRRPVQVISPASGSELSLPLAGPSSYRIEAPRLRRDQSAKCLNRTFPALEAHVLRNAVVSPYSSGVLCDDRLVLPKSTIRARDRVRTDSSGMFYLDKSIAVGNFPKGRKVPEAIHVGGAGSFNWYHFVAECLPKVFLARRLPVEFQDYPLLLPDECRSVPAFAEALSQFAVNREVIFLKRGEQCQAERLIVIDEVSVAPFNMYPGKWPQIEDYEQHDEVLLEFFEFFRSRVLGTYKRSELGRRIFLARPAGVRRDYNQDMLIKIVSEYGFEVCMPETLSLQEQARLFADTEIAVGASGAAWTGMIFRDRPMQGLSWLISEYSEFCSYSSMACLLGHRLEFIEAQPVNQISSTSEAYKSNYRIPPEEFETALRYVIGAY